MPVAEVSQPTAECPEPHLWQMYDAMSAEVEVLDFVYQLVKTIKPKLVIETGSYRGLGACYIGKALKENGRGKLFTCEVVPELFKKTVTLIEKAKLSEWVECRKESSLEMDCGDEVIDLLFADSAIEIRLKEIQRFWDRLDTRSLVVVHDVNSGAHNTLREEILSTDKRRELSVVLLPTPRGLALCQKRAHRN